jgi:hypothetical protein
MRWIRRNNRKALKALALSLATCAVFAGNATAQVRGSVSHVPPAAQQGEISYLSWGKALKTETQGGVTPTNLARAYVSQVQGVSSPDGYQPQLRGDEQLVIRDKPDGYQPQTKHADVVSISADSGRFETGDLALGFGLGLILATAAAIALAMVRDRERMAHS